MQDALTVNAATQRLLKLALSSSKVSAEWVPAPLQAFYSKALSDQRNRLQAQVCRVVVQRCGRCTAVLGTWGVCDAGMGTERVGKCSRQATQ